VKGEVDAKLAIGLLLVGVLIYLAYEAVSGVAAVENSIDAAAAAWWQGMVGIFNQGADVLKTGGSE